MGTASSRPTTVSRSPAVYELKDGKIVSVPGAGGLSPADADARTKAVEVQFALGWFANITSDMFT